MDALEVIWVCHLTCGLVSVNLEISHKMHSTGLGTCVLQTTSPTFCYAVKSLPLPADTSSVLRVVQGERFSVTEMHTQHSCSMADHWSRHASLLPDIAVHRLPEGFYSDCTQSAGR